MEFSNEVLQGLGYLANSSYVSEDNYKKIINSCLGLLSGEPNIERVTSICPEKSEIIRQAYASVLTFTIEIIRNKSEDEVQNFMGQQNFKSDRIEYYLKVFNLSKDNIVKSLENCSSSGWPSIVDAEWRLDFVVKSNMQNHVEGPLFYIVLTTEKNGILDYIKFTCNAHQLQEFSTKLKEIVRSHSRICNSNHLKKLKELKLKMADLWNLWDVKPPPVCSVKTNVNFKGIAELKDVTFDALKTLSDNNHLDREAAVLSRFLYKHRRTFRHDKGIKSLVKVYQCLKRYLKLDLLGTVTAFKQALQHNIKEASIAYLPTKQMLKWVLLRLQSFAQLFVRVTELCKETGLYVYQKMAHGWALNLSFLVFSMTARILTISKYLVAKSIEWYTAFYKGLPHLRETAEFLPDYNFPPDLKVWLGTVDLVPLKKKTFADEFFELIDLAKDEDDDMDRDEDSENEVEIVKEKFIKSLFKMDVGSDNSDVEEIIVEKSTEDRKRLKRTKDFSVNEDLGVPVSDDDTVRESFRRTSSKKFKNRKEGKRTKWLKKLKKTVNKYDKGEVLENRQSSSRRNESDVSYLTID